MNSVMFVAFAEARARLPDGAFGAMAAGFLSGIAQAFLSTPMDWVKIQAQLHGGSSGAMLISAMRGANPSVLFTGHTMNLCREGVFTAVYLGLYSHLRGALLGDDQARQASQPGGVGMHLVALTSASTGALAWLSCYPFDTVKSLQQGLPPNTPAAKRSIGSAVATLHAKGGIAAFYRGAGSSTLRAVMVTCSRLVAYELVASFFTQPRKA